MIKTAIVSVASMTRKSSRQRTLRALLSTLHKCEKMDMEKLDKSQRTLLERRIAALKIEKEQGGQPQ
jgi:hypothetical protein